MSDLVLLDALVCTNEFTNTQTSVHKQSLQPVQQLCSWGVVL